MKRLITTLCLLLAASLAQAERLKDLASIQGVRTNQLIGYGLVVGLNGTGDQTTQTPFTLQTFNNMLAQFGIKVPPNVGNVQLKNVAAVSIHADLPPFAKPGQTIDVTISSIGNDFIRDNFLHAPKPTWLFEVENAGHWSFSDIAGLGGNFMPGCGDGVRELDGGTFSYLDNDEARALAVRTITAWARFTIDDDAHAKAALGDAHPGVLIKTR